MTVLLSLTCKQGRLVLTDDGSLSVRSLVRNESWQEPVAAVRGIDLKPGRFGSCSLLIRATHEHAVTMLVRRDCERLAALLCMPFREVAAFAPTPSPPPAPTPHHGQGQTEEGEEPPRAMWPRARANQALSHTSSVARMETTVRTYKDAHAYQRDVKKMERDGWAVQSALDHHKDRSLGYKLFVPFGALSSGTGEIIVTYQRVRMA